MLKALILLSTLCALSVMTHARYSRSTMQTAMDDYAAAFKQDPSQLHISEPSVSDEQKETAKLESHPTVG